MQVVAGEWPGDEVGDQHRNRNLSQKQQHDVASAGPEYLANADLLGAAAGREGGEAKQAQAGDEYRDADENTENLTLSLILPVHHVEAVVQEIAVDGRYRRKVVPALVDEGEGLRDHVGAKSHRDRHGGFRIIDVVSRLHRFERPAELGVSEHANDVHGVVVIENALADGLLWGQAEPPGGQFIDENVVARICRIATRKVPRTDLIL